VEFDDEPNGAVRAGVELAEAARLRALILVRGEDGVVIVAGEVLEGVSAAAVRDVGDDGLGDLIVDLDDGSGERLAVAVGDGSGKDPLLGLGECGDGEDPQEEDGDAAAGGGARGHADWIQVWGFRLLQDLGNRQRSRQGIISR